jgi:hypothetical protein
VGSSPASQSQSDKDLGISRDPFKR